MAAIITITFNPALDKSITVPELISEKKLKCSQPVYEPGGGGINVARAIKKLGGDPTAIFLAGGFAGDKINELLNDDGITAKRINITGKIYALRNSFFMSLHSFKFLLLSKQRIQLLSQAI